MIEIRSYNLKPGTRNEFHNLFLREALPMLNRWKIDVVAFGPSLHDSDSYFLVRSFSDLENREKSENAFYGSEEWKKGPREAVLSLIINYTTIVVPADFMNAFFNSPLHQSEDKKQLSSLNAQFIKNFMTNDTITHTKIIHRDFVYISVSGKIVNREEYMKAWSHGYEPSSQSFEYTDEAIRVFGDMALVRSNCVFTWIEKGKKKSQKTVYTDTYIKENDKWLCVQAQITERK